MSAESAPAQEVHPVRVLSIDPAISSGWAVFAGPDNALCIESWGFFKVACSSEYAGDSCLSMYSQFANIVEAHAPLHHVFIEDYFFARRKCNGCSLNVKLRAAIEMFLRQRDMKYSLISPASWWSFIVGSSQAKGRARKEKTREALASKYRLELPDRVDKKLLPHDVYDAIGIGIYGIRSMLPHVRVSIANTTQEPSTTFSRPILREP